MTETKESEPVAEAALFKLLRRVSVNDWITIAAVLATKALLLIFGVRAYRVLEDHEPPGPHTWLVGTQFEANTFKPGHYGLELQLRDTKAEPAKDYVTKTEFDVL